MNPLVSKITILLASIVMVVIRAPHGQRSRSVKTARSWKGTAETVLLTFVWIAFFLPFFWIFSPWLKFADFALPPIPFAIGVVLLAIGLWLFHRSHVDLGTNWSITLEVRENHRLVTEGVYRRIRHPMYLSLFLFALGEALVLPNWLAGPAYLVTFGILFAFRIGAEERMMSETFGALWDEYCARSARLVPGVW